MGGGADAPHDVGLRLAVGQVGLGHRTVCQRGIRRAVDDGLHVVARQVALGAARLEEVAAAPDREEARRREELRVSAAARGAHEALGALLLVPLPHDVGDLVKSIIPRHALPLVGPTAAHALHGVLDAAGVVERLDTGKSLSACRALVHGVVRIALELDDLAVFDVRDHSAVVEAGATHGPDLLRLAALGGLRGLYLLQVPARGCGHGSCSRRESRELHK